VKTILVVDDELLVRQLYRDLLVDEGHNVLDADGADAALDLMVAHPVDLVIMDIRMPRTHGLELLTQVHKTRPRLPVIVCSALDSLFDSYPIWEAREQVAGILKKPVNLSALLGCVQRALGAGAARRAV